MTAPQLLRCAAILILCAVTTTTEAQYLKMNPPPDADKSVLNNNNSCWLATAANMLAGAGYGTGATVQARAESIYVQLTAHYGIANGGWTDAALTWWLNSAHNIWKATNPYNIVTVYGNKTHDPYTDTTLPEDIGNYLRVCDLVGLSISWPGYVGGHAITDWGDDVTSAAPLTANPLQVIVTDSDTETGGNVQTYNYDAYTNPNPGGPNDGVGWYFNFSTPHPFIKHYVVLSPSIAADVQPANTSQTLKIMNATANDATDLHYEVRFYEPNNEVLTYRTSIDWNTANDPVITEIYDPGTLKRQGISVDWDLSDNPVPPGTTVTIFTEFVVDYYNGISYRNVYFTYADRSPFFVPGLGWEIVSPTNINVLATNITGGFVIGSVRFTNSVGVETLFQHQYTYEQNPELHYVSLYSPTGIVQITELAFGHSYGLLSLAELQSFTNWIVHATNQSIYVTNGSPLALVLNWTNQLPYPVGDGPFPSTFTMSIAPSGPGTVQLSWTQPAGFTGWGSGSGYVVEYLNALGSTNWSPLTGTIYTNSIAVQTSSSNRFYRVKSAVP